MIHSSATIHPSAVIDPGVEIGEGASIWHFCHIRANAVIGKRVSLGRDVYVDIGVRIGEGTRVQNGVSLYAGLEIGDWCFIGPHAIFTNDAHPRVGKLSWTPEPTILRPGMSIGAGAIVRCGVEIGAFAMIGAGGVVTKNIPPFTLAMGVPAELTNRICACAGTKFDLHYRGPLIQPCCKASLLPEVLALAEVMAAKAQKEI